MAIYSLYNKDRDVFFIHPSYGKWTTSSEKEAKSMLKACHEYVISLEIPDLVEKIIIVDELLQEVFTKKDLD